MKKSLYGTTALIAASMLSGQAMAVGTPMTSSNFNLTLGGFATFKFEYQSQNPAQNVTTLDADGTKQDEPRAYNLEFDAELYFQGANKLPNGTTMGFKFELETGGSELQKAAGKKADGTDIAAGCTSSGTSSGATTCGSNTADLIDDNYIYLDGRWGKLTLGGTRDVRNEVGIARTWTGLNAVQIDTDVLNVAGNNRITSTSFTSCIDLNSAPNKVIWELPAMGGLKLALNWSPDVSIENSTGATQQDDQGAAGEYWHVNALWAGTIGGFATRLSGGYLNQGAEDARTGSLAGGLEFTPTVRMRIGGDVKAGNLTVGAYWAKWAQNGPAQTPEESSVRIGLGATYTMGVWTFGAGYESANQEVRSRQAGTDATVAGGGANFGDLLGTDRGTRWDIGLTYSGLGGGKVVTAGYRVDDYLAITDGLRNTSTATAGATADLQTDNQSTNKTIGLKLDWTVGPGFVQTFAVENYRYTHHNGLAGAPVAKADNAISISTALTF